MLSVGASANLLGIKPFEYFPSCTFLNTSLLINDMHRTSTLQTYCKWLAVEWITPSRSGLWKVSDHWQHDCTSCIETYSLRFSFGFVSILFKVSYPPNPPLYISCMYGTHMNSKTTCKRVEYWEFLSHDIVKFNSFCLADQFMLQSFHSIIVYQILVCFQQGCNCFIADYWKFVEMSFTWTDPPSKFPTKYVQFPVSY